MSVFTKYKERILKKATIFYSQRLIELKNKAGLYRAPRRIERDACIGVSSESGTLIEQQDQRTCKLRR